jgi:hypothetical protein
MFINGLKVYLPPAIALVAFCSTLQAAAPAALAARVPANLTPPDGAEPVVIAIVDDGIRRSHRDIAAFIRVNPLEVADNFRDDDGNGKIDDVYGWDVADGDSEPNPPPGREAEFSHGTYLAGLIAQVARQAYGERAPYLVKILPVKAAQDLAQPVLIMDGYEGIAYAIEQGADIILCAWGAATLGERERGLLDRAATEGVLIVASAGNFHHERPQFPAAHPDVFAVSAHDRLGQKVRNAAYGSFVDLLAPGGEFISAAATSDTAEKVETGTSGAAAITAAVAAIIKIQHPNARAAELQAALLNSATVTDESARYPGRMGAGKLHAGQALVNYAKPLSESVTRHRGAVTLRSGIHREWDFPPLEGIAGLRFRLWPVDGALPKGRLQVFGAEELPRQVYNADGLPDSFFVEGKQARLVFKAAEQTSQENSLMLAFQRESIDFRSRYCSGTRILNEPDVISDGSGTAHYSPESDCKWYIKAPPGHVIRFTFLAFDTEKLVDKLYFFNGPDTSAPIMGIYTGQDLPEKIVTWRNEVLIWFVTDSQNQGQGWEILFEFILESAVEPSS